MRNLRQLIRRTGWLSSPARRQSPPSKLGATRRRLSNEALEKRELLAGDLAAPEIAFAHNYYHPADVDDNRQITAGDALRVINLLDSSDGGLQITEAGMIDSYSDVNADGWVTASDALSVINTLSQPEAAVNDFRMLLDVTDANDNLLTDGTTRNITANVGDEVYLQLSYFDDRRLTDIGAFQVVTDITYTESTSDVFSPIVSETQEVNFENTLLNATSGDILITLEGVAGTVRMDINDFIDGEGKVAGALQRAVVQLGGYQEEEIVVTPLIREGLGRLEGQGPVESKDDENFPFRIRYNLSGAQANTDVPDIQIAFENLNTSVGVEVTSFSPIDPATGEVRGEAVGRSLDVRSRDAASTDPFGAPLYNLLTSGNFDPANNIFDEIRVIGPLNSGGITAALGAQALPEPLDTFSIRLMLDNPGTVTFGLDPAEDDEFVLLYGEDDANSRLDRDKLVLDEVLSVVTITVSGPDNQAPDITVEAGNGDSASQTLTETDAGLSVSDTLTVTDPDTADTVSASVVSVSESGDGTGVVSNGDLLSMLSITNNPVLDSSSTTGPINYTFDSGAEAFDHLDAGESLVLTYTVRASDTQLTDDQLVTITINGTADVVNTPPVISVGAGDSATQTLTETDAGLSASGTLTVTDPDTADVVSAAVISVAESGDGTGVVSNTDLLAMLSVTNNPVLSNSTTTGPINYTFNSGSQAFNHLDAGESLVLTYNVRATDTPGATDDQTVVVTINGSAENNNPPVITIGAGDSATQGLTENGAGLTASGTLTVTDVDTTDTVSASVISVAVAGDDNGIGNAALLAMLTLGTNPVVDNASTSGTISYTYNSGVQDFNHLSVGQTLQLTYNVRATDSSGGTDDQSVVVTITGTNDGPTATNNVRSVAKNAGGPATGNVITDDDGFGVDSDPDNNDVLTVSAIGAANDPAADVTGSFGTLDWSADGGYSYSIDTTNAQVVALADNETLMDIFTYTLSDGNGGTDSASLAITITGTNDPPTATNNSNTIAEDATGTASGNVITDDDGSGVDSDPNGDPLTVTDINGVSNQATDVTGAFGSLDWAGDGGYIYSIDNTNASVQALAVGETLTDSFTYTISDGKGGTDSATLAITITGTNDAPTATNNTNSIFGGSSAPVSGNVITDDDGFGVDSDPDASDTLTVSGIDSVTNPATDVTGSFGSLDWASDGSYNYSVDNSNAQVQALETGQTLTETFTYSITDSNGGADSATLTITITAINPSTISGAVFVDHVENIEEFTASGGTVAPVRNGIKDDDEKGLSGVLIRLVDGSGTTVDTEFTNIHGDYTFENVAPGNYQVVFDVPSTVIFLGTSSVPISITGSGGATIENVGFGAINTTGTAGDVLDILASSYNGTGSGTGNPSSGEKLGAIVSLDSSGRQDFFIAGAGFDGIMHAELVLNAAQDEALLTVIEDDGDVVTRLLTSENFIVRSDANGSGVQVRGGLDRFAIIGNTAQPSFPNYRDAIDRILADQ